jgi:hypothetical protein
LNSYIYKYSHGISLVRLSLEDIATRAKLDPETKGFIM